jgi:hypothetical protein
MSVPVPVEKLPEVIGGPDDTLAGFIMFDDSPLAVKLWVEKYLSITNEHGKLVNFRLTPQQFMMLENATGRDVTVKGRQTRASSIIMARTVRSMVNGNKFGATAIVGAQNEQTTLKGFRTRILSHIEILELKKLGNTFIWVSGEQSTMSRGFAVQFAHLSEFAHWKESAMELMGGVLPAIPSSGQVDVESTPNGEEGAFWEFAMKQAKNQGNPEGLWTTHLYPWWLEQRYTVDSNPYGNADIIIPARELNDRVNEFVPNEHEAMLLRDFQLDVKRMIWRRLKKGQQDATRAPFLQEYPESLKTCWLVTAGRFFDTPDGEDHLSYYDENQREPLKRYESLPYRGGQVSFYGQNFGIWAQPNPKDTYVMGFDAAGGGQNKEADYSVLYVMSVTERRIVAELRVRCSPKNFALMIAAIGTFYYGATVNGERESRGQLIFDELRELEYKHIYYHVDYRSHKTKDARIDPGMYPTEGNRQLVLEDLKQSVVDGTIRFEAPNLCREMGNFTWQKVQNRMKARALDAKGSHDDCVFAAAYTNFIVDKVRRRAREDKWGEEIIRTENGRVVSRGGEEPKPWMWV